MHSKQNKRCATHDATVLNGVVRSKCYSKCNKKNVQIVRDLRTVQCNVRGIFASIAPKNAPQNIGESIDANICSILRANVLISSTRVLSVLRSSARIFDYKFALLSIDSGRAVCLTRSPTILQCALVLISLSSEQWQQCHRFSCTCHQIDYLLYSLSGTNHGFFYTIKRKQISKQHSVHMGAVVGTRQEFCWRAK